MIRFGLVTMLYARALGYKCVHDSIGLPKPTIEKPLPQNESTDNNERMLQTTYRTINVKWDYSNLDSLDSTFANFTAYTKQILVPQLDSFVKSFLRVSGKTTISPFTTDSCGTDVVIPSSFSTTTTTADLIIFITGENNPNVGYVAYAGACLLSGADYRPIVGLINLNYAYLDLDKTSVDSNFKVIMHEFTHVLGFSSGLYDFFNYPSTTQIYKTVNGVYEIITPKTLAFAKAHFGCSTLGGVPLEDQGSSGSVGSHWEAKYFGNEAMTAQVSTDMVFSGLTLAFLADTKWYDVVTTVQEVLTWGKGEGCGFVNMTCSTAYPSFCTSGTTGCTADFRSISYCSTYTFMNNCPAFRYSYDGLCDKQRSVAAYFPSGFQTKGVNSRCFNAINPNNQAIAGCFKSWCDSTNTKINVTYYAKNYTCTSTGQKFTVSGYTIVCPNIARFCKTRNTTYYPCKTDCGGHGVCRADGSCLCDWGYLAPTCTTRASTCPVSNTALCSILFPPAIVIDTVEPLKSGEEGRRIDFGNEFRKKVTTSVCVFRVIVSVLLMLMIS